MSSESLFVEIHVVCYGVKEFWTVVYLVTGRDCASAASEAYAPLTDPPYSGQMFQPAASSGAAEHTNTFEDEPPLLEGNQIIMFWNKSCFGNTLFAIRECTLRSWSDEQGKLLYMCLIRIGH